jgi:hypothetical protein
VSTPAAHAHVDLHVPRDREFVGELDHGAAKVRARPAVPETRMQHAHRASVEAAELAAPQALMPPDWLQPAFGRRVRAVAGERREASRSHRA